MKAKSIKQSVLLNCTPDTGYEAWMDSKKHGEMIGGSAKIEDKVGGKFNIWDGSIIGETLEMDRKNLKIVQSWRYDYDDWPEELASKITVQFIKHGKGCKLVFTHTGVPDKYVDEIAKGWEDYYWKPMQEYFK